MPTDTCPCGLCTVCNCYLSEQRVFSDATPITGEAAETYSQADTGAES
jgi:hypothetical protein